MAGFPDSQRLKGKFARLFVFDELTVCKARSQYCWESVKGYRGGGCSGRRAPDSRQATHTSAKRLPLPPFHDQRKVNPLRKQTPSTALHPSPRLTTPTVHSSRRKYGRQVHPRTSPHNLQGEERLQAGRAPPPPRRAAGRDPSGQARREPRKASWYRRTGPAGCLARCSPRQRR
jgi:hypothetical protein